MTYEHLYENLQTIYPDLYWGLVRSGIAYITELGRLESALVTHSPETQIKKNVEGRFQDLEATVKEVNRVLQSNQPPSTPLPTDKKELSALVFELVGKVHMGRQRT